MGVPCSWSAQINHIRSRSPIRVFDVEKFCKRLGIKVQLSTAFHPETDRQTERANQDVERHLRSYCSYMQDDWTPLLPMAEFADNNMVSSSTGLTPFFANKGFHPRMTFSPPENVTSTARERILAAKADDITEGMRRVLDFLTTNARETQESRTAQKNRSRADVEYAVGDMVLLSSNNIATERPTKKPEDKMLGPFRVSERVGHSYQLQLPESMRIHDVFQPNLLRTAAMDPLPGQVPQPPGPIAVGDVEEWEPEDILDSRRTGRKQRLQ